MWPSGRFSSSCERPQRRRAGFLHKIELRSHAIAAQQGVRVREAGIGTRIVRVFVDGLLKIRDRLLKSLDCPLIPKILASEIEVVGFVRRRRRRESRALGRSESVIAQTSTSISSAISRAISP